MFIQSLKISLLIIGNAFRLSGFRRALTTLFVLVSFASTAHAAAPPPPIPGATNIALGTDTSESSPGWGGGSYPDEMLDGAIAYDFWGHGLAFTGGPKG
jgi:hypothetical protein